MKILAELLAFERAILRQEAETRERARTFHSFTSYSIPFYCRNILGKNSVLEFLCHK